MPDMAEPPEFLRILRSRIRERMAEERLSARDVSLQAKLGSSAVSDILLGRNKSPSLSALTAIAAALKTDLAFLTGKRDNFALATELSDTVRRIPIVGTVEAGSFRRVTEFDPGSSGLPDAYIDAPRSRAFPMVSTFAYEVRGEEMNQAAGPPILPGAIATCLSFDELNKPIAEGEIYVFTRAFDGGNTVETRMGRAHVFNDRTELVPESSNRSLMPVTYPSKDGADGVVTILGLVYGIHYPIGRFA